MAAYVKEILIDYAAGKLDINQRIDIALAIESLIKSKIINRKDLEILNAFLSGYCAEEIGITVFLSTETVASILIRLLTALEHASNYLDSDFVQKYEKKYSPPQVNRMRQYLTKHSRTFTKETL